MEVRERTLGADDEDTLAAMSLLVLIYSDQGEYEKAEDLGTRGGRDGKGSLWTRRSEDTPDHALSGHSVPESRKIKRCRRT